MTPVTRKKLGIILGILLVILVVGVFTVPRLIDLNRYNAPIVSAIEKALGGKAQLGRITWGLHTGLWLEADGLSLSGAPGVLGDGALKRAHADVSLLPLLSGKIVIKNLLLEAPEVSLNLAAAKADGTDDPGNPVSSDNIAELMTTSASPGQPTTQSSEEKVEAQSRRTDTSASKHFEVLITGITVYQGRVTLNDALTLPPETIVRTFTDVTVTADYTKADRAVTFDLSLRDETENSLGALVAKGTFIGLTENFTIENPQLTINAAIKDNNVAAFKPYLKSDPLAAHLGGAVSLEIDYKGDCSRSGQASGTIDLTHLTYTDRSLWDAPLPGTATHLTFAATFTPDELVTDKFSLTIGKITIDGRSRLKNWTAAPVFNDILISVNIPLAELTSLVPWKQLGSHADLLKGIIAGGGEVNVAKASLAELDPAKPPDELANLWTQVEMAAEIKAVSVPPTQTLPQAGNIGAAIRLAGGVIDIDHLTADIAAISLPEISARITQLPHQPLIDAKIKGPIKVADNIDESLRKLLSDLGFDKLTFSGDLDLAIRLETARPESLGFEGTAGVRDGLVKTSYSPVVMQGLNADITLAPDVATVSNLATTVLLPAGKRTPENPVNLTLQGQLTNLKRRPSLNLQSFKTSPVSLAALAAVIPWEQFKNAPKVVKDVLHGGGTIEIDHLSLPSVDLAEPFKDLDKLLFAVKGSASLVGVTVRPDPSLPAIEDIRGHPSLEKGVLTTADLKARIGPLTTPTMTVQVTHLTDRPKFKATAKGPMRVAGTEDVAVEKILEKYGLKSFKGAADVDLDVFYDLAAPEEWSASGSATLEGIQAVTYPAGVRLKDLQGRIAFSKQKTREWVFENLTAEINAAPIRLNGKVSGKGTADISVDLKAETRQLDLAAVSELVPAIKDLGLRGKIDLDMDIHLPHGAPLQNRLNGTLKTNQLELNHKEAAVKVKDINSDLEFAGRSATIKRLALRLNDQIVNVTGQLSRPEKPALDLVITSPDLNIDRLLPAKEAQEKTPRDIAEGPSRKEDEPAESEKPRFLRLSSANIRLEAQKGRFRGQDVEDLLITADYEKGVIKDYTLDFNTGGGHAAARGMVDMREPDHVAITVDPDIKTVPLKTIVSFLGFDETSTDGPLSASGQLKARTGSTRELLASLNGSLNAEIGRGRIRVRDSFGKSLVEMLRFMSVQNLLSGNLIGRLEGDGLLFNSAKATTTLEGGRINISSLEYDGDAFSIDADGSIDLPGNQLKVVTKLAVFDTVGKAMKLVPIVGKAADAVSSLYFTVDGALDDPKVRINPARGVVKGTEEIITAPERAIKDLMDFGKE
jgi:uncharacterized protein involved in outer membrane biogenesis